MEFVVSLAAGRFMLNSRLRLEGIHGHETALHHPFRILVFNRES
jgi:hypothetical protein